MFQRFTPTQGRPKNSTRLQLPTKAHWNGIFPETLNSNSQKCMDSLQNFAMTTKENELERPFVGFLGPLFHMNNFNATSWKGLPYRHHNDAKLVDEYPPPDHGGKGISDSQKKWYFIILQNPCLQTLYTPVGGSRLRKKQQFKTNHDGL